MSLVTEDLTGRKFGRWTVLHRTANRGHNAYWMCQCECGVVRAVKGYPLKVGASASCGCLQKENLAQRVQKHGMSSTPEYRTWERMRHRCNCVTAPDYSNYGGRGIKVAEEWGDFTRFLTDMGAKPFPRAQIDRIDNDGPYCKTNCRWASQKTQANNKRSSKTIHHLGETKTYAQWARFFGIPPYIVSNRINALGWEPVAAISTPWYPRRSICR